MNFSSNALILEIIENIIKKITHDFGNPLSAIMNACELSRMEKSSSAFVSKNQESWQSSNLDSIFQNASQSLKKKLNFFRYFFISSSEITSDHDDEIFIEIIHDFENRHSFNLNFDFSNSETIFKKILLSLLSLFSYYISKNSISIFVSNSDSTKFSFEFEIDLAHLNDFIELIKFLSTELNLGEIQNFLNPIDIFTVYFKIFLKNENFSISTDQENLNSRKVTIYLCKKSINNE